MAALTPYEQDLRDDALAVAFATGRSVDELSRAYDLTPAALEALRARLQPRIDTLRERIQLRLQLNQHLVETMAPLALNVIEVGMADPTCKDRFTLAKWVMERALPAASTTVSGQVGLSMSEGTAQLLANTFKELLAHRRAQPASTPLDEDPHLLEGGSDH